MGLAPLRAAAPRGVRFVPRFVPDPEVPAFLRRAALVVLPHTRVDQSGAAFAALAFGKPLLLTDVGGVPPPAGDRERGGEGKRGDLGGGRIIKKKKKKIKIKGMDSNSIRMYKSIGAQEGCHGCPEAMSCQRLI